ncbi:hypothetical protein JVU11DRAFT_8671 [Chiua virens]|nr:hypothetical protein JVU11DRAFT_8671 [Chiua virens]
MVVLNMPAMHHLTVEKQQGVRILKHYNALTQPEVSWYTSTRLGRRGKNNFGSSSVSCARPGCVSKRPLRSLLQHNITERSSPHTFDLFMMFARVLALLPLVLTASAFQCNTGGAYCCESTQTVQQANNELAKYNLVNAAAQIGGLVGLTCNPVTVIGTGSACQAEQQPVCCQDNRENGAVNLSCSPANVSV